MAKGKARIIVLGRSKNKSMQINTFLSEIFTQEIPAEYVSLVTLKYNDGTKREIDQIDNDIIRIDTMVRTAIGVPVDVDKLARADGKKDQRKD